MLRLLLALVFLASSDLQKDNSGLIRWNASRRLEWSDFRGSPPRNAANAALTNSGILMKFTTNGKSLGVEITCSFDKDKSWGRIKNDLILSHEQGHFDIAEIHARKLNKALLAYRYNDQSVNKDVNEIYRNVMDELVRMQNDYDEQTDYSRNLTQQKLWFEKIGQYLNGLEKFSNYDAVK